jgi:hypothetical protein
MNTVIKYIIPFILILIFVQGCSDTPMSTNSAQTETLLYSRAGLVDSLNGTCSAYMIRTSILDSIDMRNYNYLKVEMNALTDGDLSNISLYYIKSDSTNNLFSLDGTSQINSAMNFTFPSPKLKEIYYLRLKLFASVCTGQYYSLRLRDLKIYGVN